MLLLFVVSDATGETGERVFRSALVQFPTAEFEIERFGGVRTREQIREIVGRARDQSATLLHTLVSHEMRGEMLAECRRQGVEAMDLMGPVLDRLALALGAEPREQPGLFEQLEEARTRAIEAVDFAFRHDDGQHLSTLSRAEIVLVGVSRTMKTPVTLYLARRGWFACNVPIVPGVELPIEIDAIPAERIFGLTMRPARLLELRRTRAQILRMQEGPYAQLPDIRAELNEASEICRVRGWRQVNVTGKSVEEVSREILDLRQLDAHFERRREGP